MMDSSLDIEVERFRERLKKIIGNESVRSFARKADISETAMRKYLVGESTPNIERLLTIAKTAGVTVEWLVTGEGNIQREEVNEKANARILALIDDDREALADIDCEGMKELAPIAEVYNLTKQEFCSLDEPLKDVLATGMAHAAKIFNQEIVSKLIHKIKANSFHEDFAMIPGYSIQVSAGNGAINTEDLKPTRYLAFRRKWLKFRGFKEEDLALVWAKGDSMEPTINNNDTLVVHLGKTKPIDGHIYIFRNGDELFVKRYQSMLGSWRLISDNQSLYAAQDIPKEEQHQFEVIGQVVHIAKDLGD